MALTVAVTTFVLLPKADDIWWHLATGRYLVENIDIPTENLFSFTASQTPWVSHSVIFQLFAYLIFTALGGFGLILCATACNGLCLALFYLYVQRKGHDQRVCGAMTLWAAFLLLANWSLRPFLVGNVCLLTLLLSLVVLKKPWHVAAAIAVLFVAWANCHGSFLVGLFVLAAKATCSRGRRRMWGGTLGVAFLASLATPYCWQGLALPVRYLKALFSQSSFVSHISEWQPPDPASPLGMILLSSAVVFALYLWRLKTKLSAFSVLVGCVFAVAAFASIRFAPFLAFGAAAALPSMEKTEPTSPQTERISPSRLWLWVLPLLAATALTMFLPGSWPLSYSRLTGVDTLADLSPSSAPQGVIDHLRAQSEAPLFHHFDWGGALIFELYPAQRVFIDQRNDCYPAQVQDDYMEVHQLGPRWQEVVDHYRIERVAYPRRSALARHLETLPEWEEEHSDDQAVVFVRVNSLL